MNCPLGGSVSPTRFPPQHSNSREGTRTPQPWVVPIALPTSTRRHVSALPSMVSVPIYGLGADTAKTCRWPNNAGSSSSAGIRWCQTWRLSKQAPSQATRTRTRPWRLDAPSPDRAESVHLVMDDDFRPARRHFHQAQLAFVDARKTDIRSLRSAVDSMAVGVERMHDIARRRTRFRGLRHAFFFAELAGDVVPGGGTVAKAGKAAISVGGYTTSGRLGNADEGLAGAILVDARGTLISRRGASVATSDRLRGKDRPRMGR